MALASDTASELESDIAHKTHQAIHDMNDVAKENAELNRIRARRPLSGLSIEHMNTALRGAVSSASSVGITQVPTSLTPAEAERIRIEATADDDGEGLDSDYQDGWMWGINPIFLILGVMILTPCLVICVLRGGW